MRQHRRHHDVAIQAGVPDRRDQPEPGLWGGRAGFDVAVQVRIGDGQRHRHRHRHLFRRCGDQRQIPAQQCSLGQDRQRCAGLGQGADDARHQRVASFGALIGIGVGAQRHGVVPPGWTAQLRAQHVGDVGLDHDLRVEIGTAVQVQILVGRAGEAIAAGVRAAPVPVDGESERQLRESGILFSADLHSTS